MSRMFGRRLGVMLAGFLLALALLGASSARTGSSVALVPLSGTKVEQCERSGLLRPICPRLVPHVNAPFLSNLAVELTGPSILDVFNLERGGEYPGEPERNRPPRMAHIVAVAGNIERLASFSEPLGEAGEQVRDGMMRATRTAPTPFGQVRWGQRRGAVYLMPSYPRGGMLGNHLVFSWREAGRAFALSLHAWEPLRESVTTLQAMVQDLPTLDAARQMIRASPVRRLTVPRGQSTVRARVSVPTSAKQSIDAFVVVPAKASISIRIETSTGRKHRLLDSTRYRECNVRRPLRICHLQVPKLDARAGGRWTILATKRSAAPARVRVDLNFD